MAVLPFRNNTGDPRYANLGGTLAELASNELTQDDRVTLVERTRISDVFSELKLQRSDVIDQNTAVRIGRLLGARLMAFGSFASMESSTVLTVRIVDVETGQILSGAAKREQTLDGLERAARIGAKEAVEAALKGPGVLRHFTVSTSDATDNNLELPLARKPAPQSIGVIIGVRDYRNKDVPKAEYAINDALLMKRYLTTTLGYQADNIIYVENPTKAELETLFGNEKMPGGKIARYIGKRDPKNIDVFVYYSGHGAPGLNDRHAYLVPADANPDYIEINGYSRDLMLANLSALRVRNTTVVLETCFSGNFDGGSIVRKASPLIIAVEDQNSHTNINLFTSSASNQISSWYPEKEHSLFTYSFIKSISDSKGAVMRAGSLIEQVERSVTDLAGRKFNRTQTPGFSGNRRQVMAGE